jgi:lipocalin
MPSRKYAWILSRTVKLSPVQWSHIRQVMVRAGYDPDKLVETQQ